MTFEQALRITNRNMVAFDLVLGSAAIAAPEATLRVLGHDEPSRGEERDWWALAWLRGTEIATDVLWSASPALSRPGAKLGLRLAGVANVAMAAGFAWLASRE